MSVLQSVLLSAPPLAAGDLHWEWVAANGRRILELTLNHLYQAVVPVAVGAALAMPVAYYASRRRASKGGRRPGTLTLLYLSSLLYTIPSIALFVLMPLVLGTSIISPMNVLVALSVYSFSLMVRAGVDAFDSVPDSLYESARALGYTPGQARRELMVPLAAPVILSGLFTDGLARDIPSEILVGVALSLGMAFVLDGLLMLLTRILTPWRAAERRR